MKKTTLAKKIPEYRKIIDFRNIIAHGYDIIDEAAMWDFAVNRVPKLLDKVMNTALKLKDIAKQIVN